MAQALGVITDASPDSRILIVGQFGRPAGYAAAISSEPDARAGFAGTGICDFFDPTTGEIVDERIATLTGIIEG